MATTIRASCPDCGDIKTTAPYVTARVCTDTMEGSYRFKCPKCGMVVLKNADERIIDLLQETGVAVEYWKLPQELFERKPDGPVISYDDVLAIHEMLEGDEWRDGL